MSTGIEWTDETWNVVTGCTKVSPGCANCYAEAVALRFWPSQYPPVEYSTYSVDNCCQVTEQRAREFTDVQCHEDRLDQPLRWKKPRKVFVNSMSDLFHEDVPDSFIDRVFAVMADANQHTYQILTKRADRMRAYMTAADVRQRIAVHVNDGPRFWPLLNVWLGCSVENQHFADERIPLLLQTPAAVRFISAEPLLEDVTFLRYLRAPGPPNPPASKRNYLDWIIVGGESGRGARPFNLGWARTIIRQGRLVSVPVFMKQIGKMPYEGSATPYTSGPDAINCRPYELDIDKGHGGNPIEWPEDLRVRDFPQTQVVR